MRCRDQLSSEAHGRALIEFAHAASAALAARYLHGETLLGRRLCVQISPLQGVAPDLPPPQQQQQSPHQSESNVSSRQTSAWGGAAASISGAVAISADDDHDAARGQVEIKSPEGISVVNVDQLQPSNTIRAHGVPPDVSAKMVLETFGQQY